MSILDMWKPLRSYSIRFIGPIWLDLRRVSDRSIFARFMTMREKQILARAIEIQKENWG